MPEIKALRCNRLMVDPASVLGLNEGINMPDMPAPLAFRNAMLYPTASDSWHKKYARPHGNRQGRDPTYDCSLSQSRAPCPGIHSFQSDARQMREFVQ